MLPEKRNIRLPKQYRNESEGVKRQEEPDLFETPIGMPEEDGEHLLEDLTANEQQETFENRSSRKKREKRVHKPEKKAEKNIVGFGHWWLLCAVFWSFAVRCWEYIFTMRPGMIFCGWIWISFLTKTLRFCMRRTGPQGNGKNTPAWKRRNRKNGYRSVRYRKICKMHLLQVRTEISTSIMA